MKIEKLLGPAEKIITIKHMISARDIWLMAFDRGFQHRMDNYGETDQSMLDHVFQDADLAATAFLERYYRIDCNLREEPCCVRKTGIHDIFVEYEFELSDAAVNEIRAYSEKRKNQ